MSLLIPASSKCLVVAATDPLSIGYACAQSLLASGALMVTILGRDEKKVDAAVASLQQETINGATVYGVVGDLKQPESMAAAVQTAIDKMGGGLDILIISGGNGSSEYLGLDSRDLASYRMINNVGVLSPLMLVQAAETTMMKSSQPGGAAIVMISSAAANTPWPDTLPYNLSKAGQNCLVETWAFQYRTSNIRVNGVLTGCIHTGALNRMAEQKGIKVEDYAALRAKCHPMGRNGTPQDVAQAVTFLASPAASFTTGELLRVGGGLHLSNWFNQAVMMKQYVGGTKAS